MGTHVVEVEDLAVEDEEQLLEAAQSAREETAVEAWNIPPKAR